MRLSKRCNKCKSKRQERPWNILGTSKTSTKKRSVVAVCILAWPKNSSILKRPSQGGFRHLPVTQVELVPQFQMKCESCISRFPSLFGPFDLPATRKAPSVHPRRVLSWSRLMSRGQEVKRSCPSCPRRDKQRGNQQRQTLEYI